MTATCTALPVTASELLRHARAGDEIMTLALAGVIGRALQNHQRPLIRGLSEKRFQKLMNEYFPACDLSNDEPAPDLRHATVDEFDDLVALLLDLRAQPTEQRAWLAFAMASAAMGEGHLWQDMGLPSRDILSQLIAENFPTLAQRNTNNMKWKKFFYRQLCERAGVQICRSPHCAECCDYAHCFGPEN
jgi:nitrogen fixation protein NifQ